MADTHTGNLPRRTPKQNRGKARVDLILTEAEKYFTEVGFDNATTNALAQRAGVPIGSIYQFFPNKDALMVAIVERYRENLQAEMLRTLGAHVLTAPIDDIIDRLLDMAMRMGRQHFGLIRLMQQTHGDSVVATSGSALRQSMRERLAWLITLRAPKVDAGQAMLCARVAHAMFLAHIGLALEAEHNGNPAEADALLAQAKLAQKAYFARLLDG
jgi:AcrR family transcriptional regulator